MGVQSFFRDSRNFLGRHGSVDDVYDALSGLKDCWSGRLSIDLIRGLPGQYAHDLQAELGSFNPEMVDHVSIYDLTIEDGTPLAVRTGTHFNGPVPGDLEDYGIIEEAGFHRYEVSNYARPGAESMHNQGYWEMNPYLGLGPSAVSLSYYDNNGASGGRSARHLSVASSLEEYLTESPDGYTHTELLSPEDLFIEHLIMGFRQVRGLFLPSITARLDKDISAIIPDSLGRWLEKGLCEVENDRLCLRGDSFSTQNRLILEAWEEMDNGKPFA